MKKLLAKKTEYVFNYLSSSYMFLLVFLLFLPGYKSHGQEAPTQSNKGAQAVAENPAENLPPHISKLTHSLLNGRNPRLQTSEPSGFA